MTPDPEGHSGSSTGRKPSVDAVGSGPSLRDYLGVLWRRKWYIVLVALVALAVALVYSFRQTPKYKTTSTVLVLPVNFSPTEPSGQDAAANMFNEVQIVTSASVTKLAAKQLDAAGLPMATVTVNTPVASSLLVIDAESTDPASAQATANAYGESYLTFRRDVILEDLRSISQPTEERLEAINQDLVRTQQGLLEANSDSALSALQIRLGSLFSQRSLLEQKLNELVLPENLRVGEVLQPAPLPVVPFSPNHNRTGSFALFVGLSLGIGIAFLRDRLDPRLRGRDELEMQAQAPVLALIPSRASRLNRTDIPLPTVQRADSGVAEAYRVLRAGLSARISPDDGVGLVIASSHRNEGTTTVTANLGVAFAGSGRRVVVISDGVFGPQLKPFFGSPSGVGLPDVLKDPTRLAEALVATSIQNVWVLQARYDDSDLEKSISSEAMERVLAELRSTFDVALVDAPPVLEDARTLSLCSSSVGVLLVAHASRTTASSVREAVRRLSHVSASVIGAVLVDADRVRDLPPSRRPKRPKGSGSYERPEVREVGISAERLGFSTPTDSDGEPAPIREASTRG